MAVYCIVSEILVENRDFFSYQLAFDASFRGSQSEYCHYVCMKKLEWRGYLTIKKLRIPISTEYRRVTDAG